ncbi:hypothetical protein [Spirosoma luteum]|uniref:hypothetical protein n=1 Tax=Spirosoma luteum TaxID=431553 RepID=UPI0003807B59|nr:hypothetical protein [Spirosoma luteum]
MRYLMPDPSETTGGDTHSRSVETVPTGMETDPHADEEVISQQNDGEYPEPVQPTGESVKIAPDDLADSIAYALDGSGPGPTNATPAVSGHSVTAEGMTSSGLEGEERAVD